MSQINKRIGKRIKKERTSRSINQIDFSKSIGISQTQLCFVEKGVRCPDLETLRNLRKVYKIDINKLVIW